jgi:starch synthase
MIFTAVSRMVEQKTRLFLESPESGGPGPGSALEGCLREGGAGKEGTGKPGSGPAAVLEHMLSEAGDEAVFFILGTGDPLYERRFREASAGYSNLVFLNGFSNRAAEALYRSGHCFLMPSLFEPCGISQMLAMQEGQPCIVHRIGGLKDTVRDGIDGFSFEGPELELKEQAGNFLSCFRRAFNLRQKSPEKWEQISRTAASRRFEWKQSISKYLKLLYR